MRLNFSYASEIKRLGPKLAASAVVLFLVAATSACTTVEGTNALADGRTFEREVLRETLQGIGMVPREGKDAEYDERAPLVMPANTTNLPAPSESKSGLLPEDSDQTRLDTSALTEQEARLLRLGRVVDGPEMATGRPFTPAELKILSARFKAARRNQELNKGRDSLYQPPESYFTTVDGADLICLSDDGDLVSLDDPKCPADIRQALKDANG